MCACVAMAVSLCARVCLFETVCHAMPLAMKLACVVTHHLAAVAWAGRQVLSSTSSMIDDA